MTESATQLDSHHERKTEHNAPSFLLPSTRPAPHSIEAPPQAARDAHTPREAGQAQRPTARQETPGETPRSAGEAPTAPTQAEKLDSIEATTATTRSPAPSPRPPAAGEAPTHHAQRPEP